MVGSTCRASLRRKLSTNRSLLRLVYRLCLLESLLILLVSRSQVREKGFLKRASLGLLLLQCLLSLLDDTFATRNFFVDGLSDHTDNALKEGGILWNLVFLVDHRSEIGFPYRMTISGILFQIIGIAAALQLGQEVLFVARVATTVLTFRGRNDIQQLVLDRTSLDLCRSQLFQVMIIEEPLLFDFRLGNE